MPFVPIRQWPYSSVPNKRACTPYLIFTKLPHTARSYPGLHAYLLFWILKDFCQIFRLNLDFFGKNRFIFL